MVQPFLHSRRLQVGLLMLLGITLTVDVAAGQDVSPGTSPAQPFILHADSIDGGQQSLPEDWLFNPEHDPSFAGAGLDDSNWEISDARIQRTEGREFAPHGWYRLHMAVDSALHRRALGLVIYHVGASAVYLNGTLVAELGRPATVPEEVETHVRWRPVPVVMEAGPNVLAVRYAAPPHRELLELGEPLGFGAAIVDLEHHQHLMLRQTRRLVGVQFFFTALFGAFALLHLLLFAVRREGSEHLWFGLLAAVLAGIGFAMPMWSFMESASALLLRVRVMSVLLPLLGLLLLVFGYSLFYDRLPRHFYLVMAAGAVIVGWTLYRPAAFPVLFAFILVVCLELVRVTIVAIARRHRGARVLGLGLTAVAIATAFGLLVELGIIPYGPLLEFINPVTGATVLVIAMSVYLSREVARTNEHLQEQLAAVSRLSEEQLRQERRAREAELQRERAEAESRRRAKELEEARQLQLSMLPSSLPQLPDLEIAAYMSTATEVGGDYYDFAVSEAGVLTLVVGDATGHGMRAGTVVTAAKSLFTTLGDDEPLDAFLMRTSVALRRLRLPRLYMGMLVARWDGESLDLSSAGMPPVHVWRADDGRLETLTQKALPLGGPAFRYVQRRTHLRPGDVAVFMTDGLPERFSPDRVPFGYDEAGGAFARAASGNGEPQRAIERLVQEGDAWAAGAPPDDDVTFVVIRRTSTS